MFGAPNSSSGFNFGQAASSSAAPTAGGFSFGQASAAPSFGQTNTSNPGSFSLGQTGAKTTAPGGFSFGQNNASNPGSFSLGQSVANTTAPTLGGFSFGQSNMKATAAAPAFGQTAASSTPAAFALSSTSKPPLSFNAPGALTSAGTSFGSISGANKPTGFPGLGTASTFSTGSNPTPTFSLGGTVSAPAANATSSASLLLPKTSTALPGFNFNSMSSSASTTATASGFNLSVAKPAVSSATGFSFANNVKSSASTTSAFGAPSTSVTSAITSTSLGATSAAPTLKQMSYKELEETVDKWLHDLTEQEKVFLNQASQVNIWDKQLIENGEKVTELNSEVERVKAEQQRLDRELDYILSQQEELEDILRPIEDQLKTQQTPQLTQHSDIERERTFRLAENVDSQLKGMMQDLKEVIEHINNSNITQKKSSDDTMTSISKILNAHMDSLQWVDQNTNQLQKRVEEVTHLLETRKRDQERMFHLTY